MTHPKRQVRPIPFSILLVALAALLPIAGCNRGPPTLVPTLAFPPTRTPVPTETPVPTATITPGPSPIPTETPVPMATVRRQATLRTGPGVDYDIAGMAQFGEALVVYARYNGWLQVSEDGGKWIIEGKVYLHVERQVVPQLESFPPELTPTAGL